MRNGEWRINIKKPMFNPAFCLVTHNPAGSNAQGRGKLKPLIIMTEKVAVKEIIRQTAVVDNSVDAERQYAIAAQVEFEQGRAGNMQGGEVKQTDSGTQLATFSSFGSLSVNFTTTDAMQMLQVLQAVTEFMTEVGKIEN